MLQWISRRRFTGAVTAALLLLVGAAQAHVVPNMTVEADFSSSGAYSLRINVDPRTFLAADPASLPPVPASWYREQTPEQVAVTHEKAREYLVSTLALMFNGQKTALPAFEIQAMDGADNTPLHAETQEVHLLATASGQVPPGAKTFQVDYSKAATIPLILLQKQRGESELRPRVVFGGEISPPFQLKAVVATTDVAARPAVVRPAATRPEAAPQQQGHQVYLIIALSVVCILVIVGWRLLSHYRHYHRAHRKPGAEKL
ncbi:hypothetical protein [Prosthecobacter sp.]|uniref:hypothetical protein n=1 Tax=Prosthecobacter sp. TaxID=1965333 RepID=UPI003785020D